MKYYNSKRRKNKIDVYYFLIINRKMNTLITKQIQLESKYLGSDIKIYLYEKINTSMVGNCYKEYGYIMNLHPEIKIIDNNISSSNSNVIFTLKICLDLLKPSIGDIYCGKIFMVNESGILAKIMNKMNVFISHKTLVNFTYTNIKIEKYTNGKINLKLDMDINIKIIFFKYEDRDFSCIGKYINEDT